MLQAIIALVAKDKGRDINRTLVLLLLAFCAWQNNEMKTELVAIKSDVAACKAKISLAVTNSENAKLAVNYAR